MYKYAPINSYTLRNLQNRQIFFNSPENFNDPFDTFHHTEVSEISKEVFAELYCNSINREIEKATLLSILNKSIAKEDFYSFCEQHIDYYFDFENGNQNKLEYLKKLSVELENTEFEYTEILESILLKARSNVQLSIESKLDKIRKSLSQVGVCCF